MMASEKLLKYIKFAGPLKVCSGDQLHVSCTFKLQPKPNRIYRVYDIIDDCIALGISLDGVDIVIEDNKGGHKLAGLDKLRYNPETTEKYSSNVHPKLQETTRTLLGNASHGVKSL